MFKMLKRDKNEPVRKSIVIICTGRKEFRIKIGGKLHTADFVSVNDALAWIGLMWSNGLYTGFDNLYVETSTGALNPAVPLYDYDKMS